MERGSHLSASRKLKKVYPYHPVLTQAVFKEIEESKLVECFIRSHLEANLYWRKSQKEVDFVWKGISVEVKYMPKIKKGRPFGLPLLGLVIKIS